MHRSLLMSSITTPPPARGTPGDPERLLGRSILVEAAGEDAVLLTLGRARGSHPGRACRGSRCGPGRCVHPARGRQHRGRLPRLVACDARRPAATTGPAPRRRRATRSDAAQLRSGAEVVLVERHAPRPARRAVTSSCSSAAPGPPAQPGARRARSPGACRLAQRAGVVGGAAARPRSRTQIAQAALWLPPPVKPPQISSRVAASPAAYRPGTVVAHVVVDGRRPPVPRTVPSRRRVTGKRCGERVDAERVERQEEVGLQARQERP